MSLKQEIKLQMMSAKTNKLNADYRAGELSGLRFAMNVIELAEKRILERINELYWGDRGTNTVCLDDFDQIINEELGGE